MGKLISEQYKDITGDEIQDFKVFNRESMAGIAKPVALTMVFNRSMNRKSNRKTDNKHVENIQKRGQAELEKRQVSDTDNNIAVKKKKKIIKKRKKKKKNKHGKRKRVRELKTPGATRLKNSKPLYNKSDKVALRALGKHNPFARFDHVSDVYDKQSADTSFFSKVSKYTDKVEVKKDLKNYLNSGIEDASVFKKEMENVNGMKDTDIITSQKDNISGFKERVDNTLDRSSTSVDHYKKTLSPEKYKQLKESLEKFENIDTTNMTMGEIKSLTKELNTTADTLLGADGAIMSNVQKAMKPSNRGQMFAKLGKTASIAMTGYEVAKLLATGAIKGTTKLTKTIDNMSQSINKLKGNEFGSGIFVSTEQYNTERGRAMEVIQTNRINAQSYLGNEAMMTSRGRL